MFWIGLRFFTTLGGKRKNERGNQEKHAQRIFFPDESKSRDPKNSSKRASDFRPTKGDLRLSIGCAAKCAA